MSSVLDGVQSIIEAKRKEAEATGAAQFVRLVRSIKANPIGSPNGVSEQEVADNLSAMKIPLSVLAEALNTLDTAEAHAAALANEIGAGAEAGTVRQEKAAAEASWKAKEREHFNNVWVLDSRLAACSRRMQDGDRARRELLMRVTGDTHIQYGQDCRQRDTICREQRELLAEREAIRDEITELEGYQAVRKLTDSEAARLKSSSKALKPLADRIDSKQAELDSLLAKQRAYLADDAIGQVYVSAVTAGR